jgi:hypothetical protein
MAAIIAAPANDESSCQRKCYGVGGDLTGIGRPSASTATYTTSACVTGTIRDGSSFRGTGVEADGVADEDGGGEDDLLHGDGDEPVRAVAARLEEAGEVEVPEDHAAEDRPLRVRVAGEHDDADGARAVPFRLHADSGFTARSNHNRNSL